jgi:hypothetical protein
MKLENITFKPIGLGEPPYKFVEISVNNPQANITGLYSIGGKLYEKVYTL